jgi:hypothetical protein
MDVKELRVAAKELVETLGLVDKKKKAIVITKTMTEEELTKIVTDALPLIDPEQDEFTDETQALIDEMKAPKKTGKKKPAPVEDDDDDAEADDAEEANDDDDDDEPEEKPAKGKKKPAPVEDDDDDDDDDEAAQKAAEKIHKKNIKDAPVKAGGKKGAAPVEEDDDDEEEAPKAKGKKGAGGGNPKFKTEGSMAQFMDETLKAGGTWEAILKTLTKEATKRGVKTSLGQIKSHLKFRMSKDSKFLGKLKVSENGIA